jgi:hypothetical protein
MDWFKKATDKEAAAVLEATKAYVKGITKLPDVTCAVDRVDGGFAKVSAKSAAGKVAPIHGFARKAKDGKWEVIAMGSFFDPDFFKKHQIPVSLQKG